MFTSRFATGIATVLVGGVAIAALSPVLPFQGAAQATDHHQRIVKGAGMWEGELSMWMPGSDEAQTSPCTEKVIALGQMWTVSHFEMEFMGQPFSGSATLGYDPEGKKYIGTWIDSMTPRMTNMEGRWNEEKKAIVMSYESYEPTGEKVKMRSEFVAEGDVHTTTFFRLGDEGEHKQMQIRLKRKATVEAGADK
ncbi:MAG: DUF1579 domain-containing protein [bacterium]|nr:DUF1579 domain-containing protein [bacterium]